MTIVPAALALLGDRAWSLPRWLDRIVPTVDVKGSNLPALAHGPAAVGATDPDHVEQA